MGSKKTTPLLTQQQKVLLSIKQRTLNRDLREAERALTRMRERKFDTYLPALIVYLDQQFEIYKNAEHGGGAGRFDVAQAFTLEKIKMDFRLAEALLEYACKKRKAYLIAEGGQGHDAYYGSKALYDKYMAKK